MTTGNPTDSNPLLLAGLIEGIIRDLAAGTATLMTEAPTADKVCQIVQRIEDARRKLHHVKDSLVADGIPQEELCIKIMIIDGIPHIDHQPMGVSITITQA